MPSLEDILDEGWEIAPPLRLELRSGRVVTVALRHRRNFLGDLRVQRKITSDTGSGRGGSTWTDAHWGDINWLPRTPPHTTISDPDHFWAALRRALESLDLIPTNVVV